LFGRQLDPTVSIQTATVVAERLPIDRPKFHLADRDFPYAKVGEEVNWNILSDSLEFIAAHVTQNDRTLETGSGASTVVFAAAGSTHTAISPVPHEHHRIAEYCASIGVATDRLSFVVASSDDVVPTIREPLDFVLLDGTHSFPYAIVEWHFLNRLLRPGGIMVIDDAPIPAVAPVERFMRSDPDWEALAILDQRTVAFRKVRESPERSWLDQAINATYPDHSVLPLRQRVAADARIRASGLRNRLSQLRHR
jgi:predicted O-methyltransferase YrrM